MAEMRASPVKSKALKRLADIVRMAEEQGQMEFLPVNPMSLFPVSSATLENLAYGNLPMAIPSQSNIPITKTGRKQEVAELAGLLPTLPAASRGVTQGANYLGDVMTQAVTRNPQATSMRALDEIGRMSPVPQIAKTPMQSIVNKAKTKNIDLQVAESDNLIDLGFLQTPARGRGLGTETMRDLISYADQTGKPIRLTPDANMAKNMDEARLVKFYENLGFKKQEPTESPKTSGFRKFAPTYWVYTPKD